MSAYARVFYGTLALSLLLLGATACGDEDEDSTTAPTISNLSYSPDTIAVGTSVNIDLGFDFSDPEADVERFAIDMTGPSGVVIPAITGPVTGASGLSAGSLRVLLALNAPVAGSYAFTLVVEDSAGNTSNGLSGTLTAQ
ncbi:MAG: hypothetical protein AAFX99_36075 [Myxococcota bacterium]